MPYRKFSAILSLVVSIGFFAAMVALIFVGPRLFELYINYLEGWFDMNKNDVYNKVEMLKSNIFNDPVKDDYNICATCIKSPSSCPVSGK